MVLPKFLEMNGRKYANRQAFIENGRRVTYEEADRMVNALAYQFLMHDLSFNDKVMILMPNCIDWAVCYLAIQRIGAVAVAVNVKLKKDELDYIIADSEAKGIIFDDELFHEIHDLIEKYPEKVWLSSGKTSPAVFTLHDWIRSGSRRAIDLPLHDDDEASILYTSGTTGKPKGVLFTHRSILTAATTMALETAMNPESRLLHMMPLSHSAPLHLMLAGGLLVGAAHIFSSQFTPQDLVTLVENERITHFFGAPVAYLLTAKLPDITSRDLSSVQYWIYGGAPLSREEVLYIGKQLQTNRLMGVYGLTEAGPNGMVLTPDEHPEKAGSIGRRAAHFCEMALLDEEGRPVPDGEIGEIALKSGSMMKGYYKDPEASQKTFKKGWLLTGDLAKRDSDGYYWMVGRKKDVIINGGVNVYPKEVEDVLHSHPIVADVAVIGVPHPDWGETVKAFVVLAVEEPKAETILRSYVSERLAEYKCPRLYEFVTALPRNANGKVLKQQLREMSNGS